MPVNGLQPWSPIPARWPRMPAEKVRDRLRAAALRDQCRRGAEAGQPAGASGARLQCAARQDIRLGRGRTSISPRARGICRSASPGAAARPCRSKPSASPPAGIPGATCWMSGPRSRCRNIPDQIARALRIPANNVRVHQDVDVGGSYGVKRGIKQTVLVAHLARRARPSRAVDRRSAGEHAEAATRTARTASSMSRSPSTMTASSNR